MRGDRLWGLPVWVWFLQGAFLGADLLLLVTSHTVDGRIFAVMLVVAQVFIAMWFYVKWIRSQLRGEDGPDDRLLPPPPSY